MVLWVGAVVLYYFTREAVVYDPIKIMSSALIYWLGYQGLIHSKIVSDRIDIREKINKDIPRTIILEEEKNNVLKSKAHSEKHSVEFSKIDHYIKSNRRFLDPYFSLDSLANELDFSVGHVSKLINQHSNNNFSDYINSLRVEHAKLLLRDDNYSQYKIVAIGLESGFNSKSTFYSSFKKFTSQTPSDFKKNKR